MNVKLTLLVFAVPLTTTGCNFISEKTGIELPGSDPIGGDKVECGSEDWVEDVQGACVTRDIKCGERVYGHTKGGVKHWDMEFYNTKFCAPMDEDYTGPERIYRFKMPPMTSAEVLLHSPCEDLDLFGVSWDNSDTCPGLQHRVAECNGETSSGGDSMTLFTDHNPRTFLLAVDGKDAVKAPFKLAVACWEHN